MDSQAVVKALVEVDPGFVDVCKTLFGDALPADELWAVIYGRDGVAKSRDLVAKANPDASAVSSPKPLKPKKTALKPVASMGKPKAPKAPGPSVPDARKPRPTSPVPQSSRPLIKSEDEMDVVWSGEITKTDDEKRQVFGWASITSIDGEQVVDKQGDTIDPEDIEVAAYDYVLKSRRGGNQHRRDGDSAFHASDLIESLVLTPEKVEKMGLPPDTPSGWWVGYQVHDEDTWDDIKSGRKTGFSIHGRGKRTPVGV